MSDLIVVRRYAVIKVPSAEVTGIKFDSYLNTQTPVDPAPDQPGEILELLSESLLQGETAESFIARKCAVLSGNDFDHWEDRIQSLNITLSGPAPKSDGSSAATIAVSGGPVSKGVKISIPSHVSLNVDQVTAFDGSGNLTFKLKTFGTGEFTLKLSPSGHSGFIDQTFQVTPEKGVF